MHKRLGKVLLLGGFLVLFALPAGADEHCAHDAAPQAGMHAAHHEEAAIEEVPAGSSKPQTPCPQHRGQAWKEIMMSKCNMMTGCCIKSDGPLSTGLSDRPATDNDLALGDQPTHPTISRMAAALHSAWFLPQDRAEPIPRPPSA